MSSLDLCWFHIAIFTLLLSRKGSYIPRPTISGLQLAVFRDEHGTSHAIDAYCPHMGANLAVGGRVIGDCIECPFHGWKFRGHDGKCVSIPYADKGKHDNIAVLMNSC